MELEKDQKTQSSYSPAAISDLSNEGISMSPPELDFESQYRDDLKIPIDKIEHDYEADYERLQNDDIQPLPESKILADGKFGKKESEGLIIYFKTTTYTPWFIGPNSSGDPDFEPYDQAYREEVIKSKPISHRKYIEFTDVKLQMTTEDGLVTVDSGGSVGVNGKNFGFEVNFTNGDFGITSDIIPVGEVTGNLLEFPTFGLEAKLNAQLGPITVNDDLSFEVGIGIPGIPNSPSIIVCGKLYKNVISEDFNKAIAYDIFPFIGEIVDALPDGI